MIAFEEYIKIKDKCCICYFGQSSEYLILLENLLPFLQNKFVDLSFYFSCKDDCLCFFKNKKNVLKLTELKERKSEFAFISLIKANSDFHPLEGFLKECEINEENLIITNLIKERTNSEALVVTKGNFPTNSLTNKDIQKLIKLAQSSNFNIQIDSNILKPSMVLGVESVDLVNAAIAGNEVYLVNTGLGANLYKKLFPFIKII